VTFASFAGARSPSVDGLNLVACAASSGKLSWLSLAHHLMELMEPNMDALHYPVENEVVNGLTKLG
jgi:hypothetical protein